jgi:hypothetical protein
MFRFNKPLSSAFFNIKRQLLSCNADIKFNQICLVYGVTPKYTAVKCTGNLISCVRTKRVAENIRIRNEIKFLYKKKQHLNRLLYESHLDNAFVWDKLWTVFESSINGKLEIIMKRKYLVQECKLKKLRELKLKKYDFKHFC